MGSADFGQSTIVFAKLPGLKESGYSYVDADKGVNMVEFHNNDCKDFIYLIQGTNYGGFLSIRFPEGKRPVMINVYSSNTFFYKVVDGY